MRDGHPRALGVTGQFVTHDHRERLIDCHLDQPVRLVRGDDVAVGELAAQEFRRPLQVAPSTRRPGWAGVLDVIPPGHSRSCRGSNMNAATSAGDR
jgi:hypothetical protein